MLIALAFIHLDEFDSAASFLTKYFFPLLSTMHSPKNEVNTKKKQQQLTNIFISTNSCIHRKKNCMKNSLLRITENSFAAK